MARKILLADDSVTAQNMGRKILADAGYEVITVNNGSAALKKIAEAKPDLIILDVYMPGYSGLEVCQRLKEAQETSRIPVLLTVGKLEPFKPEEARRVRAEGYIVKPFEASELLSALSKLEDKIVPRAEPSKPGRFARANAALDEGRYDKTVAIDEDSGWKDRIGFPSKKKKPAEDENGDESSTYNAVNKDLRTVVDRKPAHETQKAEDTRFDLGALAPEGLPKDVTPEEIAALAAAAAQVKGKLAESVIAEPVVEQPVIAVAEAKIAEGTTVEEKPVEAKSDEKPEALESHQPVAGLAQESAPVVTFAAQRLEEPIATRTEASAEVLIGKPIEAVKESGIAVPSPAEMMAAIAGLVPEPRKVTDSSSGNGLGSHASPEHSAPEPQAPESWAPHQPATGRHADEPVTMAVAAGAGFGGSTSRWTAVSVALAADEAAISLEHEMQKAHAAFAAAAVVDAPAPVSPSIAQVEPAAEHTAAPEISSPVEAVAPEMLGPVTVAPVTEEAQAEPGQTEHAHGASAMAGATPALVTAVVKQFETVTASPLTVPSPIPAEPEPVPAQAADPVKLSASEPPQPVEGRVEESAASETAAPAETTKLETTLESEPELAGKVHKSGQPNRNADELKLQNEEEQKETEQEREVPTAMMAVAADEETSARSAEEAEAKNAATTPALAEISSNEASSSQPSSVESSSIESSLLAPSSGEPSSRQAPADHASASPVSPEIAHPAALAEPAATGTRYMAKNESEIAETTAAAWASWRRIRESGDSRNAPAQTAKPKQEVEPDKAPIPPDAAAMAVAAGAEKTSQEVPAAPEESGDIANIVDSVLADLRPKIVAEISRKLGKK